MEPVIIKQAQIMKPEEFADLRIVDWNRWRYADLYNAMQNLPKWLVSCWYTIIEYDLSREPLRDGFDWGHYGDSHHALGHRYWSFFKRAFPQGEIFFADSPDFSGYFMSDDGVKSEFMGDIGVVSASAFFLNAVSHLSEGDLWITVHDRQQIIIEASYNIEKTIREEGATLLGLGLPRQPVMPLVKASTKSHRQTPESLKQLGLWTDR